MNKIRVALLLVLTALLAGCLFDDDSSGGSGSFPQPAIGVDHAAYAPVELSDQATPVVIPGVLTLAPFQTTASP